MLQTQALIAQQQAAVLAVQRQALVAAQLQLQQQQQQQQQPQQQPWLITQTAPQITTPLQVTTQALRSVTPPPAPAPTIIQMVPSPQQQQQQVVVTSVTKPDVADRAPLRPASRSASPAPQVANVTIGYQQPQGNSSTVLQQQQQQQQQAPIVTASPVPQIIPKLEPVATSSLAPEFKISSVLNSQHQRNSISPAPVPQLQVAQQPNRPNSAPVPGHLMENPPEYVPFTLNREKSFLVSFTPPPKSPSVIPQSSLTSAINTDPLPPTTTSSGFQQPAVPPTSSGTEPGPQPTVPPQRYIQSFSPSQQHTFEAKQKFSPSQSQRASPSPYYNPRTMSPARGVSPLVHSGSRGSSPAPASRSGANSPIHPRSRDPSPAPPSRSRDASPVPVSNVHQVALIVPDFDKSSGSGTTHTSTISRPKPNPLNLPTSSLTSLPIPSPTMLNYGPGGLKSGGLATPCLPSMTPNTLTGFNNLPTPMMLTSPIHLGGAQRTPMMPLHFWSSLSPVATLSPRPGHQTSSASTFQFPSFLNGHMAYSPVVTIPAFTAFENLQSPVVTAAPSTSSIQVP